MQIVERQGYKGMMMSTIKGGTQRTLPSLHLQPLPLDSRRVGPIRKHGVISRIRRLALHVLLVLLLGFHNLDPPIRLGTLEPWHRRRLRQGRIGGPARGISPTVLRVAGRAFGDDGAGTAEGGREGGRREAGGVGWGSAVASWRGVGGGVGGGGGHGGGGGGGAGRGERGRAG